MCHPFYCFVDASVVVDPVLMSGLRLLNLCENQGEKEQKLEGEEAEEKKEEEKNQPFSYPPTLFDCCVLYINKISLDIGAIKNDLFWSGKRSVLSRKERTWGENFGLVTPAR